MKLSNKEIAIISDKDFLVQKIIVIDKIQVLFEEIRKTIIHSINKSNFSFPAELDFKIGKIFKGENYKMLPYVNLDFPKLFEKDNIFTFRTMFWWGNFFSSTLHISGTYLDLYKENIIHNLADYSNEGIYMCVNNSPWEYHYNSDNYVLLTSENLNQFEDRQFIKLSKKFNLNDYQTLSNHVEDFFNVCLKILS